MIFIDILIIILAIFSFLYGVKKSFKKRGILFLQVITCALGCYLLGDVYHLCYYISTNRLANGFYLGSLGWIGGMAFLLSSYYGAMDSLVDDGRKEYIKYKIISLAAPVLIVLMYGATFLSIITLGKKINGLIMMITILPVSYFALKHIVLPDVDLGIVRVLRNYNCLILVLCVLESIYFVLYSFGLFYFFNLVNLSMHVVMAFAIVLACKGVKKWFI